jgi:hypothetical protein
VQVHEARERLAGMRAYHADDYDTAGVCVCAHARNESSCKVPDHPSSTTLSCDLYVSMGLALTPATCI